MTKLFGPGEAKKEQEVVQGSGQEANGSRQDEPERQLQKGKLKNDTLVSHHMYRKVSGNENEEVATEEAVSLLPENQKVDGEGYVKLSVAEEAEKEKIKEIEREKSVLKLRKNDKGEVDEQDYDIILESIINVVGCRIR